MREGATATVPDRPRRWLRTGAWVLAAAGVLAVPLTQPGALPLQAGHLPLTRVCRWAAATLL